MVNTYVFIVFVNILVLPKNVLVQVTVVTAFCVKVSHLRLVLVVVLIIIVVPLTPVTAPSSTEVESEVYSAVVDVISVVVEPVNLVDAVYVEQHEVVVVYA